MTGAWRRRNRVDPDRCRACLGRLDVALLQPVAVPDRDDVDEVVRVVGWACRCGLTERRA